MASQPPVRCPLERSAPALSEWGPSTWLCGAPPSSRSLAAASRAPDPTLPSRRGPEQAPAPRSGRREGAGGFPVGV